MYGMLLRSRRYAGRFFKRRYWDLYTPQKVPILMVRGIPRREERFQQGQSADVSRPLPELVLENTPHALTSSARADCEFPRVCGPDGSLTS